MSFLNPEDLDEQNLEALTDPNNEDDEIPPLPGTPGQENTEETEDDEQINEPEPEPTPNPTPSNPIEDNTGYAEKAKEVFAKLGGNADDIDTWEEVRDSLFEYARVKWGTTKLSLEVINDILVKKGIK